MPVTAELRAIFSATQTGTNDVGNLTFQPLLDKVLQLANGTGAAQADLVWGDERTLSASASENLDLSGVLVDAFGATISALKLVGIIVIADAGNTNNVVIGGHASTAVPLFGGTLGTIAIPPGGFFYAAAPGTAGLCAVTASTGDMLKVLNGGSGTGVTYKIAILARSA